jgi:hypothetical protein
LIFKGVFKQALEILKACEAASLEAFPLKKGIAESGKCWNCSEN